MILRRLGSGRRPRPTAPEPASFEHARRMCSVLTCPRLARKRRGAFKLCDECYDAMVAAGRPHDRNR